MIYTPLTRAAMRLCYEAHSGQVDKAGVPYVCHPLHVAESMETEKTTCAALLHDVLEDTDRTEDDLRSIGVPEDVLEALQLLTHSKDLPYLDYVQRLASNDIARTVKIADLTHNSDITRLETITERDKARIKKYRLALEILDRPQPSQ